MKAGSAVVSIRAPAAAAAAAAAMRPGSAASVVGDVDPGPAA